MRKWTLATLALVLATTFGAGKVSATGSQLDVSEDARSHGAASYSVDLDSEVKTVRVEDHRDRLLATLVISFAADEGTLLDFKRHRGAHLSVTWREGFEGGLIITDHATGEREVLTAKPGENNQGEGVALIENHREDLNFLGALYSDLAKQIFDGADPLAGEEGSLAKEQEIPTSEVRGDPSDIWDPDPTCFGSNKSGWGSSLVSQSDAFAWARLDVAFECQNQWCWDCCRINSSDCFTILFVHQCTVYGRACSAPIPCV